MTEGPGLSHWTVPSEMLISLHVAEITPVTGEGSTIREVLARA
jgi:hypothetical protein